jgi:hypothetical protein
MAELGAQAAIGGSDGASRGFRTSFRSRLGTNKIHNNPFLASGQKTTANLYIDSGLILGFFPLYIVSGLISRFFVPLYIVQD